MTPDDERRKLAVLAAELTREFPQVPPQAIRTAVEHEAELFAEAPIRDFVLVLVHRGVREDLRAALSR